jgi:type II secretory pathway pseudopilin PulG
VNGWKKNLETEGANEGRKQNTEYRSQNMKARMRKLSPLSRLRSSAPKAFGVNLLTPDSCFLSSSCKAFTLLEVMTVMIIIMILMGITIGGAKYAQTKAATARAQAEIATMETALESYKSDHGVYTNSNIFFNRVAAIGNAMNNSKTLYAALAGNAMAGIPGEKVYMTFKPNQLDLTGRSEEHTSELQSRRS